MLNSCTLTKENCTGMKNQSLFKDRNIQSISIHDTQKNAPWACLEKGTLWFCFSGLLVVLCFKNIKNGWNF